MPTPNNNIEIEKCEPVYVPSGRIGWWGGPDERPRCIFDDKVALSKEDAEYKAQKIKERENRSDKMMMAYRCKKSGVYHVGHRKC